MEAKLSPRLGVILLCVGATSFAANHVSARLAFDHGASVASGVLTRATGTALLLFFIMRMQGISLAVPRNLLPGVIVAGLLVTVQSYCLYSAVARIPAALALLVFQTSAPIYVLLCWAMGKEKPYLGALVPMVLAIIGLALALDIRVEQIEERWGQLGAGVTWALVGAVAMVFVYYMNAQVLKAIDGKVRTFGMTAVAAVVVLIAGSATDVLVAPRDATGWLGLALLTVFYCIAMTVTFTVLPKVTASGAAALNFEPIALLVLAWIVLGQAVTWLPVLGCFITVGAIAWLGEKKH
jgi:drug/metabolite transporter (DMT)-like permease